MIKQKQLGALKEPESLLRDYAVKQAWIHSKTCKMSLQVTIKKPSDNHLGLSVINKQKQLVTIPKLVNEII